MFVFFVQFVNYFIISAIIAVIISLMTTWMEARKASAAAGGQDGAEGVRCEAGAGARSSSGCLVVAECGVASWSVARETLQFLYAWAQLDMLDSFVFTYLFRYGSPVTCIYQYNFYLCVFCTVAFSKVCATLKSHKSASRRPSRLRGGDQERGGGTRPRCRCSSYVRSLHRLRVAVLI